MYSDFHHFKTMKIQLLKPQWAVVILLFITVELGKKCDYKRNQNFATGSRESAI